jgi:tetratricopeptide (TPR) repeat protein
MNNSFVLMPRRRRLPGHARRHPGPTLRLALAFALLTCAHLAQCYVISPSEWAAWPDYCKTRYVAVPGGTDSAYVRLVSPAMTTKAKALLGESWYHVHHACYAMMLIARAERYQGRDAARTSEAVNQTIGELNYVLPRIPPSVPVHWKMLTIQARVLYLGGNKDAAIESLQLINKRNPELVDGYVVLGNFLYKEGKYGEARSVLETGLEKVPKPTAEMHYFLGMIALKQGSFELAREQAQKAYKLGYPLPGLRNKLKAAGHW